MKFLNLNSIDECVTIDYKTTKLFLVKDFFNKSYFKEIQKEILNEVQLNDKWELLNMQENMNRKTIHPSMDGISNIFKEIQSEAASFEFLNKINELFKTNYKNCSYKIWWDGDGYNIPMHVDNERVKISIQIYVGEDVNNYLGTSFGYDSKQLFLTPPYYPNSGYIYHNSNDVLHGLLNPVPVDMDRLSFYFLID